MHEKNSDSAVMKKDMTGTKETFAGTGFYNGGGKPSVDERYVRPQNANALMRNAQDIRQTVYLFGATGYGKTSFVADFL